MHATIATKVINDLLFVFELLFRHLVRFDDFPVADVVELQSEQERRLRLTRTAFLPDLKLICMRYLFYSANLAFSCLIRC